MYVSDADLLRHYWATYVASWGLPRRGEDAVAFDITAYGPILSINPRMGGFPPTGILTRTDISAGAITAAVRQFGQAWTHLGRIPEIGIPPWEDESGVAQRTLAGVGLVPGGWRPLIMGRALEPLTPRSPAGVRVGLIEHHADMEAARVVAEEAFAAQKFIQRFFLPAGLTRRISIYGAWADGQIAAVAAGYFMAGACGVYSVATAPRFRRYGIATALVERILADGYAAGLPAATLTCDEERVGLYMRSGFHLVGRVGAVVMP